MQKKKGLSRSARFWMMMSYIAVLNGAFVGLQFVMWNASKHFTLNTDALAWISVVGGTIVFLVTATSTIGATSFWLGEDPDEEEILREIAVHQTTPIEEKMTIVIEEPKQQSKQPVGGNEFLWGFVTGAATVAITTLLRRR